MKGRLVDRIDGSIHTMLYHGKNLVSFFNTNQEAWLTVMNYSKEPFPPLISIITIVVNSSKDSESITIADLQTFELEKARPIYNPVYAARSHEFEEFLEQIKEDWDASVTK